VKILFVAPPWAGHVNPTVSVAKVLSARGHEVAWTGNPSLFGKLLPPGSQTFALGDERSDDALAAEMARARGRTVRHLESVRFLWDSVLVPLARGMREPVERVLAAWQPDVVVVDHQAIGGALAARRAGVPWLSLCTTSASVIDHFAALPKVKAWRDGLLAQLEAEAGLPASPAPDLSADRVIVFSTDAMVGPLTAFPAHYRFVGPALAERVDTTPFPWDALDPTRKKVFVSLGTVWADGDLGFFATLAEAVAGMPWQVIAVAPESAATMPDNVIVRGRVPQLELLKRVDAVVSHGGHNTVCETLAAGVPLVVTPIRDDQPAVAEQVSRAGAGLRLPFGRLEPRGLRAAIGRVLDEPAFRASAIAVQASFAAAGGAARAAALIEALPQDRGPRETT
jgi:MGT family glycosyltransferase